MIYSRIDIPICENWMVDVKVLFISVVCAIFLWFLFYQICIFVISLCVWYSWMSVLFLSIYRYISKSLNCSSWCLYYVCISSFNSIYNYSYKCLYSFTLTSAPYLCIFLTNVCIMLCHLCIILQIFVSFFAIIVLIKKCVYHALPLLYWSYKCLYHALPFCINLTYFCIIFCHLCIDLKNMHIMLCHLCVNFTNHANVCIMPCHLCINLTNVCIMLCHHCAYIYLHLQHLLDQNIHLRFTTHALKIYSDDQQIKNKQYIHDKKIHIILTIKYIYDKINTIWYWSVFLKYNDNFLCWQLDLIFLLQLNLDIYIFV